MRQHWASLPSLLWSLFAQQCQHGALRFAHRNPSLAQFCFHAFPLKPPNCRFKRRANSGHHLRVFILGHGCCLPLNLALGNQNTLRQPLRNLPTESWVYLKANGRLP